MASKFESKIHLRPSDIDHHGHVHHSKYFDFLLGARGDQMEQHYKMPMEEFIENGWTWMVRSYNIEYKRQITLDHKFAVVRTWVIAMGDPSKGRRARSIATIGFEIEAGDTGKIAVHGMATYVMIDIKTGRPTEIPQWVVDRYSI
jgi:acyl-CoA thioester hydrolase/thioesterase-3